MKKFLSLLIAVSFLLVLTACEKGNTSSDTSIPVITQSEIENTDESTELTESDAADEGVSGAESSISNINDSSTSKPTTSTPSSTPHTHSFSDATCTSPKKCSCGATSGVALSHNFTNGVCVRCGTIDSNAVVWTYEDGGEDYIIKTNGKERIKIPCDLGELGIEDIPNDDYVVTRNIKRTHLKEYNGFVYFHLSFECYDEYVGNAAPSVGGTGAYSSGQGFYSLCLSDGSVKCINSGDDSDLVYYMALGYDGDILYFIANHGYEPGGNIYSINISQIGDSFIKKAKKFERVIEKPSSSTIVNGILYLTYNEYKTTIAISELKK